MATILVIDDERMLCDLLQEMLRRHGHEVFTAYSGREGIALHKERRPHFTLLDLRMPGMNGVDVLRQLRARNYQGGVMMLTGSQDENLLKEALDLGAVDIVDKPADLERIGLAIEVSLILAKKTPPASYRANQRSARSSFSSGQKINRPYLTINGRPNHRVTQYITAAPK